MVVGYETWLTGEGRLEETEGYWAKLDRTELCAKIMEHNPETVIEFCCGTGWIPLGLPLDVHYLGIDAHPGCIHLAEKKNPTREFNQRDMRSVEILARSYDLALAFSCLKHFTLADWDDVYGRVLRAGKRTLTTIYMKPVDVEEDLHPYVHTAVTMERVERVIKENGHRLVQVFTLPPLNKNPEPLVLTEAVDGQRTDLVSSEGMGQDGGDV